VTASLGLFATLLQLLLRAEAAIHGACVEESLSVGSMARKVRPLVRDGPVPVEAKPLESLEDSARAFVGAARAIGVLDAKQEGAAVLPCEQPVVKRGARNADVQVAGWRWCESNTQWC